MSKPLLLLDNGHGKETAGKRSPKWADGTQLFEYEFNRDIVRRIIDLAAAKDWNIVKICPEINDLPLATRAQIANSSIPYYRPKKSLLISVHANAGGGQGFEAYTTKGTTKSDRAATLIYEEMQKDFPDFKMRKDTTDGDADKENDFYILRKTTMPAVLTENFFMDNERECHLLMNDDFRQAIAVAHFRAIERFFAE